MIVAACSSESFKSSSSFFNIIMPKSSVRLTDMSAISIFKPGRLQRGWMSPIRSREAVDALHTQFVRFTWQQV
jgi:hypothetical protein